MIARRLWGAAVFMIRVIEQAAGHAQERGKHPRHAGLCGQLVPVRRMRCSNAQGALNY
jgi:hypothetical protein